MPMSLPRMIWQTMCQIVNRLKAEGFVAVIFIFYFPEKE